MELNRISDIISKNSDKEFVRRIESPEKYPTLDLGNGMSATHKMSYGEVDGRFIVFPTVVYDGKELKELEPSEAFKNALDKNETIEFDNEKDAEEFSREYKKYWDKSPTASSNPLEIKSKYLIPNQSGGFDLAPEIYERINKKLRMLNE